jgi:hypothetical protein
MPNVVNTQANPSGEPSMDLSQSIRKLVHGSAASESPTRDLKSGGKTGSPVLRNKFKLERGSNDVERAKVPIDQPNLEEQMEMIPSPPLLEQNPLNSQQRSPTSPSLQTGQEEQSAGVSTGRFGPGQMPPCHETDERAVGTNSQIEPSFALAEMEKSLKHGFPQVFQNFSNFWQEFERVAQTYDAIFKTLKEKEEHNTNQLVSLEAEKKALETELNSVKLKMASADKNMETLEARLHSMQEDLDQKNTLVVAAARETARVTLENATLESRAILAEDKVKAVFHIIAPTE